MAVFPTPCFRCAAAAAGLLLAGCGLLSGKDPGGRTTEGGRAGMTITVDLLDELTKSFADRYVNVVAEACDGIKSAASTPAQRRNAHRLKIQIATNAYDAVTGPDPVKQLVDLSVIVMLDHVVWVDERQAERFFGAERSAILTRSLGVGRDEVWKLCLRAMRPHELEALKEAVGEWRKNNPGLEWLSGVRFDVITGGRAAQGIVGTLSEAGGSIPDSVGQARLAAQRVFFYVKRLPTLVDWHAEAGLENALDGQQLPPRLRELRDLLSEGRLLAHEVRQTRQSFTGPPLQIREYSAAGERFTEAAREATVLVRELRGLREESRALVDHAAWRVGQLIVLGLFLLFAGTAGLLLWARARR